MVSDYDFIPSFHQLYGLEKLVLVGDLGLEILYNGSADLWSE